MTFALLKAWLVAIFLTAQPSAPWRSTYEDTAETLARVALEAPLFQGVDGPQRTAALFASVAWYESRFNPKAKGDCKNRTPNGKCDARDPRFQSFCLFQVGRSNFGALGITEEDILSDTRVCTLAARRMMSISFGVCRGRPFDEWLGHYASGGDTCGGLQASRHRVRQAVWYMGHVPLPPVPADDFFWSEDTL